MKKKSEKKSWSKFVSKGIKVKNKISNAKDRFADFFELPKEVIKNTTKTTMIGNDSVLVEGYDRVVDYLENYIKIKGNMLEIIIDGLNLDIKEVTDNDLVISGNIYSVNFKKVGE